ncbi:MAG: FtsW/RodA/SpoVE family cell cycle protein [Firmicutes bacterium]|nr:FtsW/RodA/SpoVE family cell cycle protein [Bacillota bacterium]MDH7496503.1 FtsW/RodA/SpoVE family cell cycle protein [Bacillota bacterium]
MHQATWDRDEPGYSDTLLATALLPGMMGMVMATVASGKPDRSPGWVVVASFLGVFLACHVLLGRGRRAGDPVIFSLVAFLSGLGLAEVLRLDPGLAVRQVGHLAVGAGLTWMLVRYTPGIRVLERYRFIAAATACLLLASTIAFGVEVGGAKSWLDLGFVAVQPSEAAKILMVSFYAGYLKDTKALLRRSSRRLLGLPLPDLSYSGPLAMMWALALVLLVFQRDLGAALLFFGVFLLMMYAASGRVSYVLGGAALLAVGGFACSWMFPHVRARFVVWLNPWRFVDSSGYQNVQSMFAVAAGGLIGVGPGRGMAHVIPASATDFVFAAICEEMGLVGGLAVIASYALLVHRGLLWASRSSDDFRALLAAGLTCLIGLQSLTIIGGVLGLVPLTGVTLPFVSYGGSSMITSFVALGLLLRIAWEEREERAREERRVGVDG